MSFAARKRILTHADHFELARVLIDRQIELQPLSDHVFCQTSCYIDDQQGTQNP